MKARTNHLDKNPSQVDWARLAAYIDGEGCITIARKVLRSGLVRTYLMVYVTNTNPRLPEWIRDTFGGSVQSSGFPHGNSKWSPMFNWVTGNAQAVWILNGCLPFFVIKREQAEIGIAHQALCGRRFGSKNISDRENLRDSLSRMKGKSSRRGGIFVLSSGEKEAVA